MKCAIPYRTWWPGAALWVLAMGTVLWFGVKWTLEDDAFASHARHIQGTVLQKFTTTTTGKGGRTYTHFNIVYEYRSGNILGEGQKEVRGDEWRAFSEGNPLPVEYLPEAPGDSRIDDGIEDQTAALKAYLSVRFACFGLLAGTIISICAHRRNQRHQRLVATGLTCRGRVTSVEVVTGKQTRTYLIFEFTDNGGRVVRGRTWDLDRKEVWYWETGREIKVWYDPARSDVFTVDLQPMDYPR